MSSPKQPRKKRRVDTQECSYSRISSEILPLVSPNQVQKSSKDPNRGMYPRNDRTENKRTLSYPSFTKASKLLKKSTEKDVESKKTKAESSLIEDSIWKAGPSNKKSEESEIDSEEDFKIQLNVFSTKIGRKPLRPKSSTTSSMANKIVNYFKPIHSSSIKKKVESKTAINYTLEDSVPFKDPTKDSGVFCNYVSFPLPPRSHCSQRSLDEVSEPFKYYGLLDEPSSAEYDENSPSYFLHLPHHVLEAILCQLPFIDLMKNRLVCSTWRDVIDDSNFIEWKKRYYGLKKSITTYTDIMEKICSDFKLVEVENCFETLLKFMSTEFKRKPSADMYEVLMKNAKAAQSELVLTERFPELLNNESKVWCLLAAALLISETVDDVLSLYKSLMTHKSGCPLHDILDAFYCVAAFLLYFKTKFGINHGLHYRVYNALYWIENELPPKNTQGAQSLNIPKGLPGQQSIHSYCEKSNCNLTNEQLRILNHRLQPHQIIKVVALAGTGKTTTLIHFAQLYPQMKFLNVMFNHSVCEQAKKCFPPNVTCTTAHSLAYPLLGKRLRFKIATKIRPHDIVPHIQEYKGSLLPAHTYAKLVHSTIQKFLFSAEEEIQLLHIPSTQSETGVRNVHEADKLKILKDAKLYWEKMIDRKNKQVKITHDVYLKLYQLGKPKLTGYHCIMVDEAQDCNLAMLDIVMSQKLPVILVGDPNQQIYGFRGAVNALENFTPTHVYYLTKSFRFGPEIAYVASCCLEVMKTDHSNTLVGSNKPSYVNGKAEGQYAVIARSNTQLINEAIRMCCQGRFKPSEPRVIHGCFVGGVRSYNLEQMLDIYKLLSPDSSFERRLKDNFISKFKSFKELSTYARNAEDNDLLNKIDLVSQHNDRIVEYVHILKEKCNYPMALANVVFSTAHKAKGLEFDTVCITDDYPIVPSIDCRLRNDRISLHLEAYNFNWPAGSEESNIVYVALTRAKKCLLLSDKLMRVLLAAQEKFEYPMPPSLVSNGQAVLECVGCNENFTPHTSLILVRRQMVLGNGRNIKGGAFCVKCATEPTVRPRVQIEPVVMFLDPTNDYAHRSMAAFVGPLPSDPPIVRDSFGAFHEMDVVYVINLNV
ncbi:F-box DNA helicase 1-like isoform X2 [Argiope bruennichi]|uniref:F-box DNA helicase 1-like isoform X2 n=1 Tax=Argiope bruennichi TaxID=94029 RepID=UPI00249585F5|nr:F-box DNA helicase 1-like isoform X2 [Argiope bruennichi]